MFNLDADYFGLFGGDKSALPLKLFHESILKIDEVKFPCWDTISAIEVK